MKLKIEKFLLSPAYPLLFSIYPILVLYSTNMYQVSFLVLFRPLLISVGMALLLFGAIKLIFHEWHKSALVTTLLIFFFLTFEHIENFLENKNVVGSPAYVFAGWLIVIFIFILLKRRFNFSINISSLAPAFNLMAIILLLFPLSKGIQYSIVSSRNIPSEFKNIKPLNTSSLSIPPEIYYIIPDGYARSDILQAAFDYDNSEFIAKLEALGFYVADCSQSNYPNISLSLSSSLNMDYIQNLNDKFRPEVRELFYLFSTLENNSIKKIFDETGYKTVAFASGFS